MTKVLVTGGAGHLGSHVCDLLVEQGHEVWCVDTAEFHHDRRVNSMLFDIDDEGVVDYRRLNQGGHPDVVYHLAANSHVRNTTELPDDASVGGSRLTVAILDECAYWKARLVFVSSAIVRYAPTLPYAIEKDAGEKYCQHYTNHFGVPTSIIRLNNVYGSPRHKPSSGNVIPAFLEQKRTKGRITITGDGSQVRDFVHYTDAVRAIVAAADRDGITECGSCVGRSIKEVAELFDCPIDCVPRPGGEVDRQVCQYSDYPCTVDFEETIRAIAK